jgi:hypothetical protein
LTRIDPGSTQQANQKILRKREAGHWGPASFFSHVAPPFLAAISIFYLLYFIPHFLPKLFTRLKIFKFF